MEILVTIGYIALCLLLFSLAIAIHEFGHFIVALKLGLKVERFSIGFGPAICKWTKGGVEYRISWIPLGGYVSIPDVDPEGTKALEGATGKNKDAAPPRRKIPAWKELLVAVAGPAMNIVLAVVLAIALSLIPSARFGEMKPEIGGFEKGSAAQKAGMQRGDVILSVGGHEVKTWSELMTEVQITDGKPTEFIVRRPRNPKKTVSLELDGTAGAKCDETLPAPEVESVWKDGPAEKAGMRKGDRIVSIDGREVWSALDIAMAVRESGEKAKVAAVREGATNIFEIAAVEAKEKAGEAWLTGYFIGAACPTNSFAAVVAEVEAGSAAEKAGLCKGDRIASVDGEEIWTWSRFEELAAGKGGKVSVCVERDTPASELETDEVKLVVTPQRDAAKGALFIQAFSKPNPTGAVSWMPSRNPVDQLAWDAGAIFRVLKALVTPKEAKATGKALGGPVMIAEGIYKSLRHSFTDGLGFLRFLSTNLAVMNLLPIPVLDGGLILFALIALVFRRRVPEKVVSALSTGFMYLLLALMAVLICSDSWRSWKRHSAKDPADAIEIVVPEGVNAV
ncbi:MAG: RIP metalloprotease RseP [Kiritimatiellae bacterium]|nr:RIP metalloprotease RseP [Kiritimatiellia bacterium]